VASNIPLFYFISLSTPFAFSTPHPLRPRTLHHFRTTNLGSHVVQISLLYPNLTSLLGRWESLRSRSQLQTKPSKPIRATKKDCSSNPGMAILCIRIFLPPHASSRTLKKTKTESDSLIPVLSLFLSIVSATGIISLAYSACFFLSSYCRSLVAEILHCAKVVSFFSGV